MRLIRSRSPLSLLVRERRATGASPSAPRQEVKNRARWVGRNRRRRALGAGSSRILRHPRTLRRGVEHRRAAASVSAIRIAETGALGVNELRVGGPRLPPRGAVRAGPTPENERSNCLRLPEESSLIGQARRSPAPRVPANEPSRAIHSRQPSPHFTVFRKIVTTITSDLRNNFPKLGCVPSLPPYLSGLRRWPPPPRGCGANGEGSRGDARA